MSTYAFIHGAGDSGWSWHLIEAELRNQGHRTVAPDLPADDESATLADYADVVVDAIGDPDDLIIVAHSFGAFTAPLVADRFRNSSLMLIAGMVPSPGEPPADWWRNTGYPQAKKHHDADDDPLALYYHDVPEKLAREALARERHHPSMEAYSRPWPLSRWPDVPTKSILCTQDRVFPTSFLRRVTIDRLGVTPAEFASGHCAALARPRDLARILCCPPSRGGLAGEPAGQVRLERPHSSD